MIRGKMFTRLSKEKNKFEPNILFSVTVLRIYVK